MTRCTHRIIKQGDIIVWPFATQTGPVTIVWCARCGAVKKSRGSETEKWMLPHGNHPKKPARHRAGVKLRQIAEGKLDP